MVVVGVGGAAVEGLVGRVGALVAHVDAATALLPSADAGVQLAAKDHLTSVVAGIAGIDDELRGVLPDAMRARLRRAEGALGYVIDALEPTRRSDLAAFTYGHGEQLGQARAALDDAAIAARVAGAAPGGLDAVRAAGGIGALDDVARASAQAQIALADERLEIAGAAAERAARSASSVVVGGRGVRSFAGARFAAVSAAAEGARLLDGIDGAEGAASAAQASTKALDALPREVHLGTGRLGANAAAGSAARQAAAGVDEVRSSLQPRGVEPQLTDVERSRAWNDSLESATRHLASLAAEPVTDIVGAGADGLAQLRASLDSIRAEVAAVQPVREGLTRQAAPTFIDEAHRLATSMADALSPRIEAMRRAPVLDDLPDAIAIAIDKVAHRLALAANETRPSSAGYLSSATDALARIDRDIDVASSVLADAALIDQPTPRDTPHRWAVQRVTDLLDEVRSTATRTLGQAERTAFRKQLERARGWLDSVDSSTFGLQSGPRLDAARSTSIDLRGQLERAMTTFVAMRDDRPGSTQRRALLATWLVDADIGREVGRRSVSGWNETIVALDRLDAAAAAVPANRTAVAAVGDRLTELRDAHLDPASIVDAHGHVRDGALRSLAAEAREASAALDLVTDDRVLGVEDPLRDQRAAVRAIGVATLKPRMDALAVIARSYPEVAGAAIDELWWARTSWLRDDHSVGTEGVQQAIQHDWLNSLVTALDATDRGSLARARGATSSDVVAGRIGTIRNMLATRDAILADQATGATGTAAIGVHLRTARALLDAAHEGFVGARSGTWGTGSNAQAYAAGEVMGDVARQLDAARAELTPLPSRVRRAVLAIPDARAVGGRLASDLRFDALRAKLESVTTQLDTVVAGAAAAGGDLPSMPQLRSAVRDVMDQLAEVQRLFLNARGPADRVTTAGNVIDAADDVVRSADGVVPEDLLRPVRARIDAAGGEVDLLQQATAGSATGSLAPAGAQLGLVRTQLGAVHGYADESASIADDMADAERGFLARPPARPHPPTVGAHAPVATTASTDISVLGF